MRELNTLDYCTTVKNERGERESLSCNIFLAQLDFAHHAGLYGPPHNLRYGQTADPRTEVILGLKAALCNFRREKCCLVYSTAATVEVYGGPRQLHCRSPSDPGAVCDSDRNQDVI